MKLKLVRFAKYPHGTFGKLYVDQSFQCYTLEDTVRTLKVQGETAIPCRTYSLVIDQSTRFQRLMPHLLDVPGFEGIRIHAGNTDKNTEGCVLVGNGHTDNSLTDSRKAFDSLFAKLQAATTPITIEITNSFPK